MAFMRRRNPGRWSSSAGEAYVRPILEFVKRHAGYRAFFWTPPMGEQGYYKAREVRLRAMEGDMFALSFTMDQVFKP